MGTSLRGVHTDFRSVLFGSVTQAVLVSCIIPLLVLRDETFPQKDSLRVGIAVDGSKYGVASVRFVVKHRELFGKTPSISLVHVVPDFLNLVVPGLRGGKPLRVAEPEQVAAMQGAAFEQAFAVPKGLLAAAGLEVKEVRLIEHNPGDAIAAYTKKDKLDLLALGSHGRDGLRSVTLGSVSTRVAARCRRPLLLIRQV